MAAEDEIERGIVSCMSPVGEGPPIPGSQEEPGSGGGVATEQALVVAVPVEEPLPEIRKPSF
jgi:hypothetical protein